MKKAKLRLTPVEVEYNRRYGICWEYHFEKLRQKGLTSEQASKIIDDNTKECYRAICEKERKEKEEERLRYEWQPYTGPVPF